MSNLKMIEMLCAVVEEQLRVIRHLSMELAHESTQRSSVPERCRTIWIWTTPTVKPWAFLMGGVLMNARFYPALLIAGGGSAPPASEFAKEYAL